MIRFLKEVRRWFVLFTLGLPVALHFLFHSMVVRTVEAFEALERALDPEPIGRKPVINWPEGYITAVSKVAGTWGE